MTNKVIASAVLMCGLSLPAFAFDPSIQMKGSSFSEACTRAHESWISFCNGYVQAVIDSLQEGEGICIPRGTTRTDIVTVAEKMITASSQLQAMNSQEAVRLVMRTSYPCS